MAEFTFHHSVMKTGKSANALREAAQAEENGSKVLVIAPYDERANGRIISRFAPADYEGEGTHRDVDISLEPKDVVFEVFAKNAVDLSNPEIKPRLIIADEAQFLTPEQVEELSKLACQFDIRVSAYGLLTNFKAKLFAGSAALIAWAESIESTPRPCMSNLCANVANHNARQVLGEFVFEGPEKVVDGAKDVAYFALCNSCYLRAKDGGEVKVSTIAPQL